MKLGCLGVWDGPGGGEMYLLLNKALKFTLTLVFTNLMISLARLFWGAQNKVTVCSAAGFQIFHLKKYIIDQVFCLTIAVLEFRWIEDSLIIIFDCDPKLEFWWLLYFCTFLLIGLQGLMILCVNTHCKRCLLIHGVYWTKISSTRNGPRCFLKHPSPQSPLFVCRSAQVFPESQYK